MKSTKDTVQIEDGDFWISHGYQYVPGILVEAGNFKINPPTEGREEMAHGGGLCLWHDTDAFDHT